LGKGNFKKNGPYLQTNANSYERVFSEVRSQSSMHACFQYAHAHTYGHAYLVTAAVQLQLQWQ